jgi:hypothetical protein
VIEKYFLGIMRWKLEKASLSGCSASKRYTFEFKESSCIPPLTR